MFHKIIIKYLVFFIIMYKHLHLYKDKLPKRKRLKTDDDARHSLESIRDDLFVEGMYHPFLDTRGYEVEAVQENNINTSEKGVTADFPELENLGWMFDSEVKDYQSLLKDRRDKMTQTFRYMLEQNNRSSVTSFSGSSPSDQRPQNLTRSNTEESDISNKRSGLMEDLRRLKNFFSFYRDNSEEVEEEVEEVAQKGDPTPPSSSSSSSSSKKSSSSRRSGVVLPVESDNSPPISVHSSVPHSVHSSVPHSVHSSSRNSARPSTILSSSSSRPSTIDYGFNQD